MHPGVCWRNVRCRQAEMHGFYRQDYATALRHLKPIDCIEEINSDSRFITGLLESYVPRPRSKQRDGALVARKTISSVATDRLTVRRRMETFTLRSVFIGTV